MSQNLHNHLVETRFQEPASTSIRLACDDLFESHDIDCSSRSKMERKKQELTSKLIDKGRVLSMRGWSDKKIMNI